MMHHQMEAPPPPPPMAPYQAQPAQQVMGYCADCRQPIHTSELRIMCRGCDSYYHRRCSGLTQLACELLLNEPVAEWACNRCFEYRRGPVVPVNQPPDCRQSVWLQQ